MRDDHFARIACGELDQFRGGSRVKAEIVDDLELLASALAAVGAIRPIRHRRLLGGTTDGRNARGSRSTSRWTTAISIRGRGSPDSSVSELGESEASSALA